MQSFKTCTRVLATVLIVHASSSGLGATATDHYVATAGRSPTAIAARAAVRSLPKTHVPYDTAPETAGTMRGAADLLSCMANLPSDDGGRWYECYDAFSSFWNPAGHNEVGEKRKGWNEQTLMMGAGFKLILLIPFLAVLAGKAITLSLISLFITFLAFLHKSHDNLIN